MVYLSFVYKGYWTAYLIGGFDNLGDYIRDRDIDNDDFRGFVEHSDLFDDFPLISTFLC